MAARPTEKPQPIFGQRLAKARHKAGLTQEQFAKLLHVSPKTIDYYERRAKNPTLDFIQRAARALHITSGALIGETPSKRKRK